jgi:hypothetical protein
MESNPNWVEVEVNGKAVHGIISRDLRAGPRELLILLSNRANSPARILPAHQLGDYRRFQGVVRAAASSHALATAKRAAFEIANAAGNAVIHGATLTVMQHGVVPAFVSDERCTVFIDGQERSARLALYPKYETFKKDDKQLSLEGVAGPVGRPENFYIARMLGDYLDDCIDKYFIDIGRHFRRIVGRSNHRDIFLQIRFIREILTRSLRTKLQTVQGMLSAPETTGLGKREIQDLLGGLTNAVVTMEVLVRAVDEALRSFYEVLGLRVESEEIRKRGARWKGDRICDDLAAHWGKLLNLTCEDVEHLLGHDPRIAAVNALLNHVQLGSPLEDPGTNLEWLRPYYEFAKRVSFLRENGLQLHDLNVFLSKRLSNQIVGESTFAARNGTQSYKFRQYSRDTPPANDFYDEIDWLIWACYGFVSIMEKSTASGGDDNLTWLLRELDLAIHYNRSPNIAIVRSDALTIDELKRLAGDERVALYRRPHIDERTRRALLVERIEKIVHITHAGQWLGDSLGELGEVVETVQKAISAMQVRFAADFLIGWASLFSGNALKAIQEVYAPQARPMSSAKARDRLSMGKNAGVGNIEKVVEKYQISLNGSNFKILSVVKKPGPPGSQAKVLERSLDRNIPLMFPGVDTREVLEQFIAGLPTLFTPQE